MIDFEILAFESMQFFPLEFDNPVQSLDRLDQLWIVAIMSPFDGVPDFLRLCSLSPSVDNLEAFPIEGKGDVVEWPLLSPVALV